MTELLEIGNKLSVSIFCIFIVLRVLHLTVRENIYEKKVLYAVAGIDTAVIFLKDAYVPKTWMKYTIEILAVFLLVGCYEIGIVKKIVLTALINIVLAVSEGMIVSWMGKENRRVLLETPNGESILLLLSHIVLLCITLIAQKLRNLNEFIKGTKKIIMVESIFFFLLINELTFLCINGQDNAGTESVLLISAELTIYLMIYLKECLIELFESKEQAAFIEKEKEYYRKEAELMQKQQEMERQFRHDWNNRLQILNKVVEQKDMAEVREYISEIKEKTKQYTAFSETGNLIIDSIINSKLRDAEEKNIDVGAKVTLPRELSVNSDDMVVILGNLLDNAIEACEYVKQNKKLELFLDYKEGCIVICIKNTCEKSEKISTKEFRTRKADKKNHGIGLKSVKNTVEKYKGMIEFEQKEMEFIVNVILYIRQEKIPI